jgi:Na+-translocating ferredoxin:NAD+ oxidoreductase RnfC subunit
MGLKTSFNGVSLPPQKVSNPAIEDAPLPKRVVLPLGQNGNRLCKPVVEVGEQVKTGQLIGQSDDFLVAPVHSSISGTITAIRPWVDLSGDEMLSVIVESDGNDHLNHPRSLVFWSVFPKQSRWIPSSSTVSMLSQEWQRKELSSPSIAPRLLTASESCRLGVQVFRGKDKYPLGLNPILIKCVTGKEIPLPDGNELDIGVAVVDAVTLVHLVEAVRNLKPQVEKVVSISGAGITAVQNFRVRLGTLVQDLIEQQTDIPVSKETDALIFQTATEAKSFSPDACINCGLCVRHCPSRLLPNELSKYCEFSMFEEARDKFLLHCIECGICAYVCPEKRPMLHLMRYGKRELSLA